MKINQNRPGFLSYAIKCVFYYLSIVFTRWVIYFIGKLTQTIWTFLLQEIAADRDNGRFKSVIENEMTV